MGLFSSIGNAISSVTKPFSSFLSGSGIGNLLGFGSDALGFYNDLTGNSAEQQKELMAYQAQIQNESWKYQMSNRHQLEVGDLRNAGLNPILSANSAGGIAAAIPNGALADSDSARYGARSSAALARQNAEQVASLIQTNASTQARNEAEAKATLMNSETQRMQTLGNLSLQKTQALVNNALKGWYVTQASNLSRYPSNNGRIERELRGVGRIIDDSTESLLRSLRVNSAGALDSTYHVHVPGTNRSYSGFGTD